MPIIGWKKTVAEFDEAELGEMFMSHAMIDQAQNFPHMDGPAVFKKAIVKFPEVIMEALAANGLTTRRSRHADTAPGESADQPVCAAKTKTKRRPG